MTGADDAIGWLHKHKAFQPDIGGSTAMRIWHLAVPLAGNAMWADPRTRRFTAICFLSFCAIHLVSSLTSDGMLARRRWHPHSQATGRLTE